MTEVFRNVISPLFLSCPFSIVKLRFLQISISRKPLLFFFRPMEVRVIFYTQPFHHKSYSIFRKIEVVEQKHIRRCKIFKGACWSITISQPHKQIIVLATKLSRILRKPDFCLCENKGADQLCSNCTADQRLCFRYSDSTIPLLLIA